MNRSMDDQKTADLAREVLEALRRTTDEVVLCRRIVMQARDQFIAAEVAAERATAFYP